MFVFRLREEKSQRYSESRYLNRTGVSESSESGPELRHTASVCAVHQLQLMNSEVKAEWFSDILSR